MMPSDHGKSQEIMPSTPVRNGKSHYVYLTLFYLKLAFLVTFLSSVVFYDLKSFLMAINHLLSLILSRLIRVIICLIVSRWLVHNTVGT